jgi:hypothetical protein
LLPRSKGRILAEPATTLGETVRALDAALASLQRLECAQGMTWCFPYYFVKLSTLPLQKT